uniref:Homeobox domain-containing protein n=1 Tax=Panagrellus redivivus TaxID=6233 RepID=A0A7E4WAZ0_PANRE
MANHPAVETSQIIWPSSPRLTVDQPMPTALSARLAVAMYHPAGDPNFFFNCIGYDKGRARRERTTYNQQQLDILEKVFKQTHYPDCYKREELSARIGIPEGKIQTWFKNRRAREKNNRCPSGSGGKMVGKLEDESPPDPDGSSSNKSISASSSTPSPVSIPSIPSIPMPNQNQNAYYGTPEQWWQAQGFQNLRYPPYNNSYPYWMNYPYNYYPQNGYLPPSSSASPPAATFPNFQTPENAYNMPPKPF